MEVPSFDMIPILRKDQGVVGGGVHLDLQHAAYIVYRVAAGPMNLWNAAERVCILHPVVAMAVRLADLRAGHQAAQVRCHGDLSRMRTHRMQPRIERPVGSA